MANWTATLNIDFERTLAQVVEVLYPDPDRRALALAALEAFAQALPRGERPRVFLGILRLSKGDPDRLQHYVSTADYRDILMWAEYPETSRTATLWKTDPERYAALRRKEQDRYLNWIRSLGIDPHPRGGIGRPS